jgi:hypothetical protein
MISLMQTRVVVLGEIRQPCRPNGWSLAFQRVIYNYPDGEAPEGGFRFIWYKDTGDLQPARGQARIPTLDDAESLIRQAQERRWTPPLPEP